VLISRQASSLIKSSIYHEKSDAYVTCVALFVELPRNLNLPITGNKLISQQGKRLETTKHAQEYHILPVRRRE
jgi:hypothetical protein